MSVRGIVEALAFLTIAAGVHLLWFSSVPGAGPSSGAQGGGADASLQSAGAELAMLVESWDEAPPMALAPATPMTIAAPDPAMAEPAPAQPATFADQADAPLPPDAASAAPEMTEDGAEAAHPDIVASAQPPALASSSAAEAAVDMAITQAPAPPAQRPGARPPPIALTSPPAALPPRIEQPTDVEITPEVEVSRRAAPRFAPPPSAKPKPPRARVVAARAPRAEAPAPPASSPRPEPAEQADDADQRAAASVASTQAGGADARAATGDDADATDLLRAWGGDIRREIEREKPRSMRRNGSAYVALTVSRSGELMKIALHKSSGSRSLDNAAMTSVRNAAPFVPAPRSLSLSAFEFILPIRFSR